MTQIANPPAGAGGGGIPPVEQLKGRPLGRVLNKMGRVSREQVVDALNFQKQKGGALGQIMIDLGYITEGDLNIALAAQRGYELVDLTDVEVPEEAIKAVPAQTAQTHKVLPLQFDEKRKRLLVAMASHDNFQALDDLRSLMGYTVTAKIGDKAKIEELIKKHYQAEAESFGSLLGDFEADESVKGLKGKKANDSIDLDVLKGAADANPVRKLINLVLLQAIKDKASDIHFEPFEDEFKMRYRIDGVLYEMMPPPAHIAPAIASRIK